jgi:hypothetical protein
VSLQHRDVARFGVDRTDVSRFPDPAPVVGVDAYVTGGMSTGDNPTGSFADWDIVFDTDRFPPGWSDQIGAAAGLLHPAGTGPAITTVTFYAWA